MTDDAPKVAHGFLHGWRGVVYMLGVLALTWVALLVGDAWGKP